MTFLARLQALLSNGTPGFTALESRILRETMALLDPIARGNLQRRIDQINLVQRLGGGEEVNSYQMRKGKVIVDTSTALRCESGESVLSTVTITSESGLHIRGKLVLVDGGFFSMEFDKPTEQLSDLKPESLAVSVQLS